MAIALLSQGVQAENTVAATTLNVPYPATLSSTAILVLAVSATSTTGATLPSGFTQIFRASPGGSTATPSLLVAIKQATGSETGNLAVTTPSAVSIGQLLAFSGVDTTTPQDVTATSVDQNTALTSTVLPTLSTTRTGVCLVYAADIASTLAFASPPTSPATFTETMDRSASTRAATMGYLIWGSSGATGSVTVSWGANSGKSVGALLALRPAPAFSDTAALSGSGTLTATGTPGLTITGSFSGSGTLTATGTPGLTATPSLSGTGTLTATGTPGLTISGSFSGDGTLTTTGTPGVADTAALSGSGTLTTTGTPGAADTAALSGDGTLSTTGSPAEAATASLAGTGTLGAVGSPGVTDTVSLSGAGTLAVTGVPAPSTTVALSGTGTLAAVGVVGAAGFMSVWDGAAWVKKPVKVWDGAAWVAKPVKVWNGTAWVAH